MADYGFNGGRALGLQHFPFLAVVDREGVLQYVKHLAEITLNSEELSNVLLRVRSGDDVAGEMRREYEAFLDLYQERLSVAMTQAGAGRDDGKLAKIAKPEHVKVSRRWTNDRFQQPGNLRAHQSGQTNELTLLDGWRTVIQLDASGQERNRKQLDLGSRESISIVRSGNNQENLSVVFSVMGRTVRVLDEQLQTLHTVEVKNDQQRIREANLFDFDDDGKDDLIVSFTGPRGTEIMEAADSSQNRQLSNQSFRSSTVIRKSNGSKALVFCDVSARLRVLNSGDDTAKDIVCDLVAATNIVSRVDSRNVVAMCAVGTNRQGRWTAVGIDENLKQTWSVPIGSQRFDTQIESLAYAQLPGSRVGIWAVAAADGSIKLIGDDGKLVDNWNLGVPIHGLELLANGSEYMVVISTVNNVQGWALSAGTGNFMPASSVK